MLDVYLFKNAETVLNNEDFFKNKTCYNLSNNRDVIKSVIKAIDKAEVSNAEVEVFNRHTELSRISTGCKTVLNILLNPDRIFSIRECGANAKDFIFTLGTGRVFVDVTLRDITAFSDDEYLVHFDDTTSRVVEFRELVKYAG